MFEVKGLRFYSGENHKVVWVRTSYTLVCG